MWQPAAPVTHRPACRLALLKNKFKSGDLSSDGLRDAEIAELRRQLNCGACKLRRRDTIITKCMHVFCNDCIKSVIDNRSRKCPQCGVGFSATEYKRIYLS
jgi:E3 ubiquitin-protein ligase BRE1